MYSYVGIICTYVYVSIIHLGGLNEVSAHCLSLVACWMELQSANIV